MSYNVRCPVCDLGYPWHYRLADFQDIFSQYQPDLYGGQEFILPSEVENFLALPAFANHSVIYFPGTTSLPADPDATIFYRCEVELMNTLTSPLSPPHAPPQQRHVQPRGGGSVLALAHAVEALLAGLLPTSGDAALLELGALQGGGHRAGLCLHVRVVSMLRIA